MRLITDENISWRLKKMIPEWEILPSNEINFKQRLTDIKIWEFAKANEYAIITFDEDFSEIQNLLSYPPKIIWLRTGNMNTTAIASLLKSLEAPIDDFLLNEDVGIYEIYLP